MKLKTIIKKNNNKNISEVVARLKAGEVIGLPTETVYGLAGRCDNKNTIENIYKIKNRPKSNPLIIHYYDLEKVKEDCNLNDDFSKLYKRFCPGPLTFILNLKKNSKISEVATNKKNSLAVRFPKHHITRNLLKELNFPTRKLKKEND